MNLGFSEMVFLVLFFGSILAGVICGNRRLGVTEESKFSTIFCIWLVTKQAFFSFIVFAIVILIAEFFLKGAIWGYLVTVGFCIVNFFYTMNKIKEEYEILLKPGEGILTEEGRRKLREREVSGE